MADTNEHTAIMAESLQPSAVKFAFSFKHWITENRQEWAYQIGVHFMPTLSVRFLAIKKTT
jgi:hypothetical protein